MKHDSPLDHARYLFRSVQKEIPCNGLDYNVDEATKNICKFICDTVIKSEHDNYNWVRGHESEYVCQYWYNVKLHIDEL